MQRRGVCYDVGRYLDGDWRKDYNPQTVHRELEIIRDDLHCNAVRICSKDLGRLAVASEDALGLGLEVSGFPQSSGTRALKQPLPTRPKQPR